MAYRAYFSLFLGIRCFPLNPVDQNSCLRTLLNGARRRRRRRGGAQGRRAKRGAGACAKAQARPEPDEDHAWLPDLQVGREHENDRRVWDLP